jgi:phage terminase large subunit-like protein
MSPACKELERLVLGKYLRHNNNPVLTWAMDNVMISSDPAGNIKPAKNKATERIDPAVALVTAIATMLESQGETESPYTQRGIITL